jgi:hypothetical protein
LYMCKSRPDFRAFLCIVIRYWRSRTSGIRYSCEIDVRCIPYIRTYSGRRKCWTLAGEKI